MNTIYLCNLPVRGPTCHFFFRSMVHFKTAQMSTRGSDFSAQMSCARILALKYWIMQII